MKAPTPSNADASTLLNHRGPGFSANYGKGDDGLRQRRWRKPSRHCVRRSLVSAERRHRLRPLALAHAALRLAQDLADGTVIVVRRHQRARREPAHGLHDEGEHRLWPLALEIASSSA